MTYSKTKYSHCNHWWDRYKVKVYENHSNWEEERQLIIDLITRENIPGVVFPLV